MHLRAPLENGTNASSFRSPMNLPGLNVYGSSQYRAAQLFINSLIRVVDEVVPTIIMESRDADVDNCPGRDRERNRLSSFISNAESGILGTILRSDGCLE